MRIRGEKVEDIEQIRLVNIAAFCDHPHSNQTEHKIVESLRDAKSLTLSLVAEDDDGKIIGHIAFSPVKIDGADNCYGLGPVAVLPSKQNQGIGSALIREGMKQMKFLGAKAIVLLGEPEYYKRFGFSAKENLFLKDAPLENFMVHVFSGAMPQGEVFYHPAFYLS